jgi:ribosomal protein S18 acetylase RimI-like enzyme
MTDLVFRPLAAGEIELFTSLTDRFPADRLLTDRFPPDPSLSDPEQETPHESEHETALTGVAWLGRDYAATVAAGHYRPQWTWVAIKDDHVVARAAWYGGPSDDEPFAMDWFDPGDDPEIGAALIRAATRHAPALKKDYPLILPPDWRDDPTTHAAATRRIEAAKLAGMAPFIERLHLTWTADRGAPDKRVPDASGRLRFERITDVREPLKAILTGTLDAYSRRDVEKLGADGATKAALDVLEWLPGTRDDWTAAYNTDGDLVGVVIPSRNYANAVIAFVGVVPGHRGHGYAFDLLAEGTHLLVRRGETEIHADTDVTNTPMAATFARAGYLVTRRTLVLTWE